MIPKSQAEKKFRMFRHTNLLCRKDEYWLRSSYCKTVQKSIADTNSEWDITLILITVKGEDQKTEYDSMWRN